MKIRKAEEKDIKGIAKVHVDSWKTTYRGIISDNFLDALTYEQRERIWVGAFKQGFQKTSLYVAENEDGEVVGFASGGPERTNKYEYDGELYAIYLLEEYQGQQLGKQLKKAVAGNLFKKGFHSLLVWVLADNPSRKFYESFSPEKIDIESIDIGGAFYDEIAYGWKDIKKI